MNQTRPEHTRSDPSSRAPTNQKHSSSSKSYSTPLRATSATAKAAKSGSPTPLATKNAVRLSWSYLQDMRHGPEPSPVKPYDLGSDIEIDDDEDDHDHGHRRRNHGHGSDSFRLVVKREDEERKKEETRTSEYVRQLRQKSGYEEKVAEDKVSAKPPLGFGTSSPTKRLDGTGRVAYSDNPWVPSTSFDHHPHIAVSSSSSSSSGLNTHYNYHQSHNRHQHPRGNTSPVSPSLFFHHGNLSGFGQDNVVSGLESQIKDLRLQIRKMAKNSTPLRNTTQTRFEANLDAAATHDDYDDDSKHTDHHNVNNSSSRNHQYGDSVNLGPGISNSHTATAAAHSDTWAERVRREFEEDGLLNPEDNRNAVAREAGLAHGGIGRLHKFGDKKITIPQPFSRMERHAVFRAEKKKMQETDDALKSAADHGRPKDYDKSPVPEQVPASVIFNKFHIMKTMKISLRTIVFLNGNLERNLIFIK